MDVNIFAVYAAPPKSAANPPAPPAAAPAPPAAAPLVAPPAAAPSENRVSHIYFFGSAVQGEYPEAQLCRDIYLYRKKTL